MTARQPGGAPFSERDTHDPAVYPPPELRARCFPRTRPGLRPAAHAVDAYQDGPVMRGGPAGQFRVNAEIGVFETYDMLIST